MNELLLSDLIRLIDQGGWVFMCVCVCEHVCVCGFNRLANDSMLSAHHLAVGRFG